MLAINLSRTYLFPFIFSMSLFLKLFSLAIAPDETDGLLLPLLDTDDEPLLDDRDFLAFCALALPSLLVVVWKLLPTTPPREKVATLRFIPVRTFSCIYWSLLL